MTDTDIEEEMLQLNNEFEKAMQQQEQKEPEPDVMSQNPRRSQKLLIVHWPHYKKDTITLLQPMSATNDASDT
jgi:hypothetical protein